MEDQIRDWEKGYQPYELDYWRGQGIKDYSNEVYFQRWWEEIFSWIGAIPEGEVLDIGSGPRPPLKRGSVIEPLGEKYIEIGDIKWWEGIDLYSKPAEEFIPTLTSKFDFIMAWNSIDHSYDHTKILENIKRYAKDNCKIAIATDCFFEPHKDGHPILGVNKEDFIKEVEKDFKIIKREDGKFKRHLCLILQKLV